MTTPSPSTRVRILRLCIRQTVENTLALSSRGRGESARSDARDLRHVRHAKQALFRHLSIRVLVDLPDVLGKVADRDEHATGRGELRAWCIARVRSAGHGNLRERSFPVRSAPDRRGLEECEEQQLRHGWPAVAERQQISVSCEQSPVGHRADVLATLPSAQTHRERRPSHLQ